MLNFTNMASHAVDSGCTKMIYKNGTVRVPPGVFLPVTRLDEFVNFATMAEGSDEAPSGRRSKSLFRRLYERPACPHPAPLERDAFWRSQAWLSRLVLETQLCAPLTRSRQPAPAPPHAIGGSRCRVRIHVHLFTVPAARSTLAA